MVTGDTSKFFDNNFVQCVAKGLATYVKMLTSNNSEFSYENKWEELAMWEPVSKDVSSHNEPSSQ